MACALLNKSIDMKSKDTRRQGPEKRFNPKGTGCSLYPTHSVQGEVLVAQSPFLISRLAQQETEPNPPAFQIALQQEEILPNGSGIGEGPSGGEQAEVDDFTVIGPFAASTFSDFTPIVASVSGVAPDTTHAVSAIGVKPLSHRTPADDPSTG